MPMVGYNHDDWKQFIHYLGEASKHINKKEIKRLIKEEGNDYTRCLWEDPIRLLLDYVSDILFIRR